MIIRKAQIEDSKAITTHMLLAMKHIVYKFIGVNSIVKASVFLEYLIRQKGNQYSYENCWVIESKGKIIATVNIYDGAKLHELRTPVKKLIKSMFDIDFHPEDETSEGEFYIDCIGVDPNLQGKGIGTKVLNFLIETFVNQKEKTLGLLVDKDNPKAKKLYLKLGFETIGEKTIAGKAMEHLQLRNKTP